MLGIGTHRANGRRVGIIGIVGRWNSTPVTEVTVLEHSPN